jgi:hypothetical protein
MVKLMPASLFIARAVVAENLREKFDHWYSADHLPWAIKAFRCEKAWRFWSEVEQGVHYAVYRFADKAACDAALGSDDFKALIADFNKSWPEGVTRTRDVVTLAEERTA